MPQISDRNEILTSRLRLRRARSTDLDAMHAVLSNRAAMRYWSTAPHTSREQTRAWLDTMIGATPPASEDFVIEHEGQLIGKAGCYRLPEIGFILHPAYWRRGIAREALAAIIPAVFARYAIPAIEAEIDPLNAASHGLLHALGFRETHRAAGTWCIEGVCPTASTSLCHAHRPCRSGYAVGASLAKPGPECGRRSRLT